MLFTNKACILEKGEKKKYFLKWEIIIIVFMKLMQTHGLIFEHLVQTYKTIFKEIIASPNIQI